MKNQLLVERFQKLAGITSLNEEKMDKITDDLVAKYKKEVKTNEYDWELSPTMSNKFWTKLDGRKYKEPGKFGIRVTNTDDAEAVDKKRQVQTNFWPWLIKQPGVKSFSQVSGEFRSEGYNEAVEYKGIIFMNLNITGKHTLTQYFSKGRFKNSGMWNKKDK